MAPFAEFHVGSVLEGREEDPQSRAVLTHNLVGGRWDLETAPQGPLACRERKALAVGLPVLSPTSPGRLLTFDLGPL